MQIFTKNGHDVTGLYVMVLEGTISKEEFNNKIKEISNESISL